MHRPRLCLLAALAALPSSACYRWTQPSIPATAVIADAHPERMRIRRTDGSTITLRAPRIVTDSTRALGTSGAAPGASDTLVAGELLGRTLAGGETARGGRGRNATVVVRTSEIGSVEVRELSAWRTAAFVALAVGGLAGALLSFAQ